MRKFSIDSGYFWYILPTNFKVKLTKCLTVNICFVFTCVTCVTSVFRLWRITVILVFKYPLCFLHKRWQVWIHLFTQIFSKFSRIFRINLGKIQLTTIIHWLLLTTVHWGDRLPIQLVFKSLWFWLFSMNTWGSDVKMWTWNGIHNGKKKIFLFQNKKCLPITCSTYGMKI